MEQQETIDIKSGKISDIGEIIISYPYFFAIVEPLLVFGSYTKMVEMFMLSKLKTLMNR